MSDMWQVNNEWIKTHKMQTWSRISEISPVRCTFDRGRNAEKALSERWTWTSNLGWKRGKSLLFFRLRSEFKSPQLPSVPPSLRRTKGPKEEESPPLGKEVRGGWSGQDKRRGRKWRGCVWERRKRAGWEEQERDWWAVDWFTWEQFLPDSAGTRAGADSARTCSCWPLTPAAVNIHLHCHTIQTDIARSPHPDTSINIIYYNTHRRLLIIHSKVTWLCLYYCCIKVVCTSKHIEMTGNPNISRQQ